MLAESAKGKTEKMELGVKKISVDISLDFGFIHFRLSSTLFMERRLG